MARYAAAIWKPVIAKGRKRIAVHNRLNLHVAVSEAASLFGYFNQAGKPDSHFYVRKDGTVEQYVDTDLRANADLEGNDATISIETQGGVTNAQGEPWTEAQLVALAQIYAWAIATHGVKAVIATNSVPHTDASKGLSTHRLGIDPWRVAGGMHYSKSRGKICPGNAKVAQVPNVFARATGAAPVGNPVTPPPPPAPAPTPVTPPKTWVQRGDKGALVEELQRLLNAAGWSLTVDGDFGPRTEQAVKEYQGSRGLIIDGIAGDQTFGALRSGRPPAYVPPPAGVLQRGSTGAEVERLQRTLRDNYPLYAKKLVVDGVFGPATEAVVKEFQRRAGLVPDGIVGPKTRAALGL